jgi:toxin CptA
MSSTKYVQPLRLQPKASRLFIVFLTVSHLTAIAVLFPLELTLWVKISITITLVVSLLVSLKKQPGRVGERGVQTLTWEADGDWLLETTEGESLTTTLHESTYVHPWFIVLNFREAHKRGLLSFVLAPDALDAETFRALRVRLKVAGQTPK